ncbi:MAG TPA: accessory Sec system translocase SecA2 [Pirellulales bacterium]|nr:accessory Sec system translocase SecA2 [Pirellulales bacterium]
MGSFVGQIAKFLARLRSGAIDLNNVRYERQIAEIHRRAKRVRALSDGALREDAAALGNCVRRGTPLDKVTLDAFVMIKEAARRAVGMEPYDVQLLAGLAMFDGKLVEMQTGEGKTLAAVFPAALRAMPGRGVHVLTYNDYLAARDAEWMGPIYRFLGLTVGHVEQEMPAAQRRAGYACDVTYATAKEAGFDFLRDQLRILPEEIVQRDFHFAIVDEADSILIDEARVPLVIAGSADEDVPNLFRYAEIVRGLRPGVDYSTDDGWRNVSFNLSGLDTLQRILKCGELHTDENADILTRLSLALQAEVMLRRDVDYLVRDGQIALIDELTGRVAENRRWPYGLQAAIEAKEDLAIEPQGKILNSITLQHFLEQYERVSGMTGTAQEAAEELYEFYGMKVVVVPPHRPCIRRDQPDHIFPTKAAKYDALVREIARLHASSRPVLVGTPSVEESETLAALVSASGIACRVLNARNDRAEAAIVAEAGALGRVTISTNMAGRGTDIRLGGSDERQRADVVALGGLYVLGTNRHESRRIDHQLRGRAGRQGDPGETRFFVSMEDDLIHRHGIAKLVPGAADAAEGARLDEPQAGRKIAHVQRVIEGESFEIRRTLRKYSYVLERQRRMLHERRKKLLAGGDVPSLLRDNEPEFHETLVGKFGEAVVRDVERQITLCQIDRCWSEHLSQVTEIREGIHLISIGGLNAFDEFNLQVNAAFRELSRRIEEEVSFIFANGPHHGRRPRSGPGGPARPVVHLDLYDQRQSYGRHLAEAVARVQEVDDRRTVTSAPNDGGRGRDLAFSE